MVFIYWNSTVPLLISCFLAGICVCVVQYDAVNFFHPTQEGAPSFVFSTDQRLLQVIFDH